MLFFSDANFVLLATPKTGSTAYHSLLKKKADIAFSGKTKFKHMSARHFDRHMAPYLKKAHQCRPERAAVIRDPLSQLGSWYRYRQRPKKSGNPSSTLDMTFDEFVMAYLSEDRPQFAKIGSQFKFVTNPKGMIRVHHLFAYEKPEILRTFLERKLGFDCATEQLNVSPEADTVLSADTENRLRDALSKDFDLHRKILGAGGHLVTNF